MLSSLVHGEVAAIDEFGVVFGVERPDRVVGLAGVERIEALARLRKHIEPEFIEVRAAAEVVLVGHEPSCSRLESILHRRA